MPLSSKSQVHFSSLETSFFQAGDELSTRPDDELHEPVCAMRAHCRWMGSWPIAGATIGAACVAGLALFGRVRTEPAPQPPNSTVAKVPSVRPAPTGPPLAHNPAKTKAAVPRRTVAGLARAPSDAAAVRVASPRFAALTGEMPRSHAVSGANSWGEYPGEKSRCGEAKGDRPGFGPGDRHEPAWLLDRNIGRRWLGRRPRERRLWANRRHDGRKRWRGDHRRLRYLPV
jgi:hypothetical protein